MKRNLLWLFNSLIIAIAVFAAANTQACHVYGTMLCPGGTPYSNVLINITGSNCGGATNTSVMTDANGNYYLALADCDGCYTATIDTTTLPAGATIMSVVNGTVTNTGSSAAFCVSPSINGGVVQITWTVDSTLCGTPPLCTCVNPVLLDTASAFSVFELGSGKVTLSGPSGVAGNVAIGPKGYFEQSGSTVVTGNVVLDSGATYHPSGTATSGGVINMDLSAQITAAKAASTGAAAQPCTQTFNALNATKTISSTGPINVICVQSINLGGGAILTLSGGASDIFIVNVSGNFALGGGSRIQVTGGLLPNNVIYNLLGTGPDVNVGGASKIDGTLLAVGRNLVLSAGIVNGSVISGRSINITSGEQVICPCH